jgi:hypothetical protein
MLILNMKNRNLVILSVFLIIISLAGAYYIVFIANKPSYTSQVPDVEFPTPTPEPAIEPGLEPSVQTQPDSVSTTPQPQATDTPDPIATDRPIPTTMPEYITYTSTSDGFSVSHKSSRSVYQDTRSYGQRYTFFKAAANIAIHTGDSWSWQHPGRTFSSDFQVDGKPTFVYKITSQTLVDIENNGKKYTIQCIHNGIQSAKDECDAFISSFKFI